MLAFGQVPALSRKEARRLSLRLKNAIPTEAHARQNAARVCRSNENEKLSLLPCFNPLHGRHYICTPLTLHGPEASCLDIHSLNSYALTRDNFLDSISQIKEAINSYIQQSGRGGTSTYPNNFTHGLCMLSINACHSQGSCLTVLIYYTS